MEDYFKRKREGSEEEDIEGEEEWAQKRNKKTERMQDAWCTGGKEELGKMIGEMGNKIMERLNEELRKLKIGRGRGNGERRREKWD